jgi:hypothetical protein
LVPLDHRFRRRWHRWATAGTLAVGVVLSILIPTGTFLVVHARAFAARHGTVDGIVVTPEEDGRSPADTAGTDDPVTIRYQAGDDRVRHVEIEVLDRSQHPEPTYRNLLVGTVGNTPLG